MIDYASASSGIHMNQDWKESLEWMNQNTPDIGINYTQIYDSKTFKYSDTAYGVMSWWDYGHMITYIAKRIPNANPFQQGITEEAGSANFFISINETEANAVLDAGKTRYIITDIEMDSGKFYAMATWYNATVSASPYQMYVIVENGLDSYTSALLNKNEYYLTMISRLHNFDGSYTEPTSVYYVEYSDPELVQMSGPLVTNAQPMNYIDARMAVSQFNMRAGSGRHAMVASPIIVLPVEPVPALQHHRLVHESPTNVFSDGVDVKYVKIFEYVKGARIKGDGMIGVSLISNTGRTFMYKQESVNGEFIVTYSTNDNPYDVMAISQYHIIGTEKYYDVTEEAVMNGLSI
jgi:dolichyl-diphosphooligosaccharide--protein glycosyltransferase